MKEFANNSKAGYPGHDAMREKAERMFKDESAGLKQHPRLNPPYAHEPKPRLYKKGGHVVEHCEKAAVPRHHAAKHHAMPKAKADAPMPKKMHAVRDVERVIKREMMKKDPAKKQHYAQGGGVYEKEMEGMRPSRKMPHFNYEADMDGMPAKRSAYKLGGPVKKLAMGGVGKIRHEEATKKGAPLKHRVAKGR